jgi:hypothetical protein
LIAWLACAAGFCQDGQALFHKMQQALRGTDKLAGIRDFDLKS